MVKIAICDDEKKDSSRIENIVNTYLKTKEVPYTMYTYQSGEELMQSGTKFDLVFLDISMQGINGIQVGKRIRDYNRRVKIIYITSYQKYFMLALNQIHAFAYLEKPVAKDKVEYQLNEIIKDIQESNQKKETIKLKVVEITEEGFIENRIKIFNVKDIIYFEYINRRIKIKLENEEYYFVDCMKNVIERMRQYSFSCCHQSYLVNLERIKRINGYELFLDNQEIVPISQKKSAEFRKRLNKFINDSI